MRDEDLLLGAFSSVIDAIHAGRPALQQVGAGATLYILSLLYSAQQPGQDGREGVARAIHEAMRRMADPTQDTVRLTDLARGLGVSYSWFRRTFAHHTGLSPHQYRLQLRVGRARTLLSETALTVKEVAFRCGFESEQYFCRLFRHKTGVSPGEWRRGRLSPRASRRAAHGEGSLAGEEGAGLPQRGEGPGRDLTVLIDQHVDDRGRAVGAEPADELRELGR